MNKNNNILIIEDDNDLREEVVGMLSFENYNVLEARDGISAIELAKINKPDLILCDIMMQGIDGYDTIDKIRENLNSVTTPVVFISALSARADVRKGMSHGANDYLTKPFAKRELLGVVENQLAKQTNINNYTEEKNDDLRKNLLLNLPHEFRTPLNSIVGYGSILKMNDSQMGISELKEIGDNLLESGNRLTQVVDQYLQYAELLVKSHSELDSEIIKDAHIVLADCATIIAYKYDRVNDLMLVLEPVDLNISDHYFKMLITNIVDNSFKFSHPDSKVDIKGEESDGFYNIIVKDNGIGFPDNKVDNIGAFVQFDRDKNEQQGIGLGLAIAKMIAKVYGGKIVVGSTKKGTRVCLKIKVG